MKGLLVREFRDKPMRYAYEGIPVPKDKPVKVCLWPCRPRSVTDGRSYTAFEGGIAAINRLYSVQQFHRGEFQ